MQVFTPRPTRRRRRREALVRVTEIIANTIMTLAMGALFAWVLVNWMSGCGEVFIDAYGNHIAGECLLMPWRD